MTDATKLDWFPFYFQRAKGSKAYKMPDYQFGWYMKLLIECADSPIPGYLPASTDKLWRLAGAKSQSYFEKWGGCELVSELFCRTEIEGQGWIYNKRMLQVLYEQHDKLSKRARKRVSSLSISLQSVPDFVDQDLFNQYVEMREKIKKPMTGNAVTLAYRKLEKLKEQGQDPSAVLEQSIFRSWAGLFPIEVSNGNGRGNGLGGPAKLETAAPGSIGAQANRASLANESCPTCGGSGWDTTSGKAIRCKCFEANRKARATASGSSQ